MSDFQTFGIGQGDATQFGQAYPFVDPPDEVRYLLGDFWLSYPDDDDGYELPLRVSSLDGFDQAGGPKDLIVVDDEGTVVFDTSTATSRTAGAWGRGLVTLRWSAGETVARTTMRTVPPPWEAGRAWSPSIALGVPAELNARCYQRLPRRVRSITVGVARFDSGNLVVSGGFNCRVTADVPSATQFSVPAVAGGSSSTDGGRRAHTVSIRAQPGDGLGTVQGCADVVRAINRFNGVSPTVNGDFLIDALGCYRLQRPVRVTSTDPRTVEPHVDGASAESAAATLQLHNDCGPCCSCDDFINTYEGLRRLVDRYATLGRHAEAARDQYAANVARWNAQAVCRAAHPLKLTLNAEPRGVLFVGGLWCNPTDCCLTQFFLRTTFEYFRDGLPVDAAGEVTFRCRENYRAGADTGYAEVQYQPGVQWPVMDHHFDAADPHGVSRFRNRMQFSPAGDVADTVRVTLSVHVPDQPDCALPDPASVTVDAGLLAIWNAVDSSSPPARAALQSSSPVSQTAGCCG